MGEEVATWKGGVKGNEGMDWVSLIWREGRRVQKERE